MSEDERPALGCAYLFCPPSNGGVLEDYYYFATIENKGQLNKAFSNENQKVYSMIPRWI